jgi:hypothetical protein
MVIPKETMSGEEYERWEKGLPALPKKKIERPEPIPPKIQNQIKWEDLPIEKLVRIQAARKRILKNEEGVTFIGYDAIVEIKDSKPLTGFFFEGDMEKLRKLPVIAENTDARLLSGISF